MQLNGANLLIAAQQAARQASQVQSNAKAFCAALASASSKDDLFAPLDFKQPERAPAMRPTPAQGPTQLPGSRLDIRI